VKDSDIFDEFLEEPDITIKRQTADSSETKLCDIISSGVFENNIDIGMVGIPFDLGVLFSKGRVGARKAPDKIREQLGKYGTTFNIDYLTDISNLRISDLGNVIVEKDNPIKTYNRIKSVIDEMLKNDVLPLVLGGGHDITFPCIEAFSHYYKKIGGLNIDVHFDVREQTGRHISSGMAFRKILEDLEENPLAGENFAEIGADGNVNSSKYWEYLNKKNVTIYPIKHIRDATRDAEGIEHVIKQALQIAGTNTNAVFTSLDIDSVSSNAAPGCSFINPNGFTTDEISRISYTVGFDKKVRYFDLVEVNPEFDVDNRTTRLCARIISCFLTGYKQRIERYGRQK
jgi:formimidoylglutamase